MHQIILMALFQIIVSVVIAGTIPLNEKKIHVSGAGYIFRSPAKLFCKRFADPLLSKPFSDSLLKLPPQERIFSVQTASSTSGIKIQFKTKSAKISLTFTQEEGLKEKGYFRIIRDGIFYREIPFSATALYQSVDITLDSLAVDKEYIYEIIFPSYSNFSLTRMELDDAAKLSNYQPIKKKVYISFGDSITHGRGQDGASYLTYPYILSQQLNMELYNLGIGGSRIALPVAAMASDLPKADVITILIGYNDLNGANKTVERFEKEYRDFLAITRKKQPGAKIFCISLLYTKKTENPVTHATPDAFRGSLEKLVTGLRKSDKKIFFVPGEKITSPANLRPGEDTDPVHLTVTGAKLFADELYNFLRKEL